MSRVLLFHHLGLGDHFMVHGMVREYATSHERVGVFCKRHNLPTVRFMFRDVDNLEIIPIDRDEEAFRYIFWNKFKLGKARWSTIKYIGFQNLNRTSGEQLEQQFYRLADVPFEKKWESFHIERDKAREEVLYNKINPALPYAFVHDDNRYPLDDARIPAGLARVRTQKGLTDNVIDYLGIIERAAEIHAIDSSFMFLIDCMQYNSPGQKLVIHRYARPDNAPWQLPVLRKKWVILE